MERELLSFDHVFFIIVFALGVRTTVACICFILFFVVACFVS